MTNIREFLFAFRDEAQPQANLASLEKAFNDENLDFPRGGITEGQLPFAEFANWLARKQADILQSRVFAFGLVGSFLSWVATQATIYFLRRLYETLDPVYCQLLSNKRCLCHYLFVWIRYNTRHFSSFTTLSPFQTDSVLCCHAGLSVE